MSKNNPIDALADAAATVTASDGQMSRIRQLLAEESDLQLERSTAEALLTSVNERLNEIKTRSLPQAMNDAGVTKFTGDNGLSVALEFSADGALGSPRNEEEAAARDRKIDLIIENGGDEIVKMTVAINFPKDLFHEADQWRAALADQLKPLISAGVTIEQLRTIHPMTLKKWVKESMEAGAIDNQLLDELGIWYGQVARVKRPKDNPNG